MKSILGKLHYYSGRNELLSNLVVKVKNQCNSIIKHSLCVESNPKTNGEYKLILHLKKEIKNFVDIGANIGNYSAYLLDMCEIQNGYVFEPSKKCYQILSERFKNNSNIQIINQAISNYEGITNFYYEDEQGETSSLLNKNGNSSYEVQVTKLDNISLPLIDFLKIDTEGYDLQALKGTQNHIKNNNIRYIQFEYGPYWKYTGSTLYDAIEYLKNMDYIVYRIDKGGLYKHNYEKYGEYFSFSNFLAVSKQNLNGINELIVK